MTGKITKIIVPTPSLIRHLALEQAFDKRTPRQRLTDQVFSFVREIFSYMRDFLDRRICRPIAYHRVTEIPLWKENSEGLFVFLHGFNGHPATWKAHLTYLKNCAPFADLFVPYIPKAGDCPLEQAAAPLLKPILDYAQKHPHKPICLVGFSNGSRIASWLEVALREKAPHTPVRISTIAGVHMGTPLINLLEKAGLAKWFCSPAAREELRHLSQKTLSLWAQVCAPLPSGLTRCYDFWASTEDSFVGASLSSALPCHNPSQTRLHLVHGYGHTSVVRAIARRQLDNCLNWIRATA